VLASLSLLMLYTVILALHWRVWRFAVDGEDNLHDDDENAGIIGLTIIPTVFFCLWPAFNLFLWIFSLSIFFSICFLPTALLLLGIMYLLVGLLGRLHHWAKQIVVGKWDANEQKYDPEDKMQSSVPTPAVQVVYNVTAPYHVFFHFYMMLILGEEEIAFEETSGNAFFFPVFFTLLMFSLSPLVRSGDHLAFHAYSGHKGGPLIGEEYAFTYDTSHLTMPTFNPDLAAAVEAVAFGFDWPELDWGPENFKMLSRDLQTCTVLLAFLKSATVFLLIVVEYVEKRTQSRTVGIAEAASGAKLVLPADEKAIKGKGKDEDKAAKVDADDGTTNGTTNLVVSEEGTDAIQRGVAGVIGIAAAASGAKLELPADDSSKRSGRVNPFDPLEG
jgi:hypothetical protein